MVPRRELVERGDVTALVVGVPVVGVLVAALTTILGFGALITARHAGMASLGLTLALGVTFCMVAALVWLPAALRLLDDRGVMEAKTATIPVRAKARVA